MDAPRLHTEPPDLDRLVSAYLAAWNERDASRRLHLLQVAWSDGGTLENPIGRVYGRTAMHAYIAACQACHADCRFVATEVVAQPGRLHVSWALVDRCGLEVLGGHDYAELDADGRIRHLVGFFAPCDVPPG